MQFSLFGLVVSICLLLFAILLIFLKRKFVTPHVKHSDLNFLKGREKNIKEKLSKLPEYLFLFAFILFGLALIDPHYYTKKSIELNQPIEPIPPTKGIAIYLVLDHSGSMNQTLIERGGRGKDAHLRKMDLLKKVTHQFVKGDRSLGLQGRPSDMIGLVVFARSAKVLSPLTLDHEKIVSELDALDVNPDFKQFGTAIGYAIYKTVNMIAATRNLSEKLVEEGKRPYEIKNAIIVLVTDGFQEINPEDETHELRSIDIADAAEYAKKNDVKLYIVNIEPTISKDEYADKRKLFELITEYTNGRFFMMNDTSDLGEIYREIDQLEKSEIPGFAYDEKARKPHYFKKVSFAYPIMFVGMVILAISILLETVVFRRLP